MWREVFRLRIHFEGRANRIAWTQGVKDELKMMPRFRPECQRDGVTT